MEIIVEAQDIGVPEEKKYFRLVECVYKTKWKTWYKWVQNISKIWNSGIELSK